jgi:hypothetical protein
MVRVGQVILMVVLVSSGCVTPSGATEDLPSALSSTTSEFTMVREGYIQHRIAGDEPPFAGHEGDAPTFCFIMPPDTRSARLTFTWDTPQHMTLEAHPPGSNGRVRFTDEGVSGPLVVELEEPEAGEWFAYGGPAAAGGHANYRLEIAFVVDGAATLDDTAYDGPPCF